MDNVIPLFTALADVQRIKLIARVMRRNGELDAEVLPERRPISDSLGSLEGSEMGIIIHTDSMGAVASTVRSVGGLDTALTMLRDVVNLSRERGWAQLPR